MDCDWRFEHHGCERNLPNRTQGSRLSKCSTGGNYFSGETMTHADRQRERKTQIIHRVAWFVFGVALSNFITTFAFMVIK